MTSALTITLGVVSGSVVLAAFGGVGWFDMLGSIALVAHFRHAIHHEKVSERRERIAHLIVAWGLGIVGTATLGASALRLASPAHGNEPVAGLIASAMSIVVLGILGASKRRAGRLIPSQALMTDGSLSLVGCGTATCTVAGLGLEDAFGWTWVDPAAAIFIGVVAVALSMSALHEH